MDVRRSPDHRLLQVFVSKNGVFETYIAMRENAFYCTCPGFQARRWCKHCEHIRTHAEQGYALDLILHHDDITDEIAQDPVKFRDWVIRNTKVVEL